MSIIPSLRLGVCLQDDYKEGQLQVPETEAMLAVFHSVEEKVSVCLRLMQDKVEEDDHPLVLDILVCDTLAVLASSQTDTRPPKLVM